MWLFIYRKYPIVWWLTESQKCLSYVKSHQGWAHHEKLMDLWVGEKQISPSLFAFLSHTAKAMILSFPLPVSKVQDPFIFSVKIYVKLLEMSCSHAQYLQSEFTSGKCLYGQSYGFSSSHVCMWELNHKESWARAWKNWRFELWWWRRLLKVSWTARRSSQSILKEINSEYSLEKLVLKLKL